MSFKALVRVIVISYICTIPAMGQTQEWVVRYNGPGNDDDEASAIALDKEGNVYVTGYASVASPGVYYDYATLKYDPTGAQQWISFYDGTAHSKDQARGVNVDDYGYIYVAGNSWGGLPGSATDYAAVKYDPSGVQQWASRYDSGPSHDDYVHGMAIDSAGNIYVTGAHYTGQASFDADWATVKINSSGVRQWAATFGGAAHYFDIPDSIVADDSENVYVAGSVAVSQQDFDFATVKYDSAGHQLWLKTFNGSPNAYDEATAIIVDPAGNLYVTGYSEFDSESDIILIKYDPAGTELWVARYADQQHPQGMPRAITLHPQGGVCITGSSGGFGDYHAWDYITLRYSANGTQLWSSRYDGLGHDRDVPTAITTDLAGNVYVTGSSNNGSADASADYATIKYDAGGVEQWVTHYDGPGGNIDAATGLAVDQRGNVYVTGYSYASSTQASSDYATVKYRQPGWPIIASQPLPARVCTAGSAAFEVDCFGTPNPSLQWRKNGLDLTTDPHITGVATATLVIDPVVSSDAGYYEVLVSNELGAILSDAVELVVRLSGDGNSSGRVDGSDIQGFVLAVLTNTASDPNTCPYDMNSDGVIDQQDIEPFVTALLAN